MMDAVTFVKERRRICEAHPLCGKCPLSKFDDCKAAIPEDLVKEVEAWSKEHPLETNGMKVWELIPGDVRSTYSRPANEHLPGTIKGREYMELLIRKSWWDDEYKEEQE